MGLVSSPSDQRCPAILKSFVFFILISAVGFTEASIHIYDRDPFREVGTAYLLSGGSEGIAAPGAQHVRSYIRFENITFWRSKEAAEHRPSLAYNGGLVQVVIFEAANRDNIGGSPYGGQRSICCTADLAKLEGCKQGEVIRTPSATDRNWPVVMNVYFRGNMLSTHMKKNKEINIKNTGMYNLFFITCDPKLKGLRVTGRTVWRNPTGFLPGRMAPLMKFYVFMSIAYAILCGIWVFQYVRHWNDVLLLQHCITSVIALGLLEMTFWYFDYAYFNSSGTRPVGITTWVVTIGAIRRTISRILILSVAMGYGVVRPTLGGLTTKVLLVGVTYFLASEMLNIAEYVGSINDIAGRVRVFFVLPVALLDAFLISWIFTSLSKTLEQLQAKRSSIKLEIYRKFSNALAVTVIASVVWIGYEVYFKATDPFNERWQNAWIITAFWDILAFALLCIICYLWAPSQSCQRYAYTDNHKGDTDEEETESLCKETPKGSIGLVKQDSKDDETSDQEEAEEEIAMNGGGAEDAAELHNQTLKERERILGPTRRPDGTLRKPIRIRAGYVPQDEVAIYQSKGSMWKKEMSTMQEVPPGYDPVAEPKPKSKSAKRNERKKEKRQQAALNNDKDSDQDDVLSADNSNDLPENVESTSSKMSSLSLSESALAVAPPTDSTQCSNSEYQVQDTDKKIRALKKKIRLTEAQQQKTQEADMKQDLEKLAKLEGWRNELKLLEDKKSQLKSSIS